MLLPNVGFAGVVYESHIPTVQDPVAIADSGTKKHFCDALNHQHPARKRGQVVQTGCGVKP